MVTTPGGSTSKFFSSLRPTWRNCDLYHGSWIYDSSGPLYRNNSCPQLTQMQNCQGNGRPDKDYENWRWKPSQCGLPRFDPKKFLELMREKTLVVIGDSVARNQMESLLCILWQTSGSLYGALIGSVLAFNVADFLGRRELIVATLLYLIGAIITAGAPNFGLLVVGRFVYGIGVPETLHEEVLGKMGAPPKSDVPIITPNELTEADGLLFGFPTRFGMMASQFKTFLDATGGLWQSHALVGKPADIFAGIAKKLKGSQ